MALVKNPFLSTDARGSMSGMTASITPAGNTIRRKPNPAFRVKQPQAQVRSFMGWTSRQWGLLSDIQRAAWKSYAIDHPTTNKFGDTMVLSGFNQYVKLNIPAIQLGGSAAIQDAPPFSEPPTSVDIFTAITGITLPGDVDLSWTELGAGIAGDFFQIRWAGPFGSAGRVEVFERLANTSEVAGNVLLVTIADLIENFWYWFAVRYVDEFGQTTNWHMAQATPKLTI